MSRDAQGVTVRGTTNKNCSGSAKNRRAQKCWLLARFGDGVSCPCFSCGRALLFSTMGRDRIVPGLLGGRYIRTNLRPSCGDCNRRAGNLVRDMVRRGVPKRTILKLCRNGEL